MRVLIVFLFIGISGQCLFGQARRANADASAGKLSVKDTMAIKQFYFSGLRERTIENYQLAAEMFNRVLDIDPNNDAAMYELAALYSAQNQPKKAEQFIKSAVARKPDNEWYWLLLADIYKRTNNLSELVTVFSQLIRLKPDTDDFYFDKANALVRQNKIQEATAVYTEMESRFGLSEDLVNARQRLFLQSGKSEMVIADLEKKLTDNPADIRNYVYLGELYAKAGDKDKALKVLKRALAAEPSNPLVRLSLADLYRSNGKPDEAFIQLKEAFAAQDLPVDQKVRILLSFFPMFADVRMREQADELSGILVKTNSDDPKAYALRGDVLFQLQKYGQARAAYQQALKLNDQVYLIWEQLLRIDVTESDFKQAIDDGETALSIFPNQAPLYLYTGIAYAQVKKYDKAISYLKNAASLEVEDKNIQSQVYASLGDVYHAMKRYKESDQAYDRSLELLPDNTYTLNNYAYYLSLRGESLNKAEKMSRRSNQLEPDNPSFEDTLAWVLFKNKEYAEARTWIEKSLDGAKAKSSTRLEHYGDILYHLGDKSSALSAWKKAKEAGSKSDILERKINEKKYFE